jgi:ABC-type hemin transport system substrate-binding protein
MRQTPPTILLTLLSVVCILHSGCERTPPSQPGENVTIVSLSPAVTNLLVAMGLRDKIVGISPYDADPELIKSAPKMGDYQRIDWERLAQIKPDLLIVQGKHDKLPPGIRERCDRLGIGIVVTQIDRINEIYTTLHQLGLALNQQSRAEQLAEQIKQQLSKIPKPHTPVPTLIILDDQGKLVAGRGNFINDILEHVGGVNVIQQDGYVTLDREKIRALNPRLVLVITTSPEGLAGVEQNIRPLIDSSNNTTPQTAILKTYVSSTALMPGACVVDLANGLAPIVGQASQ